MGVKLPAPLVPWLFLLLALPAALYGLAVSSPVACSQLPGAFGRGVTTEHSDVAGGLIADRCETTRLGHGRVETLTIVNWSGLFAGIALCVGAWLFGSVLVQRVNRRAGTAGIGACGVVFLASVFAAFL